MAVTEQENQEQAVQGEEAQGEGEKAKGNQGRAKVSYLGKGIEMEALDELPESAPAGRSRLYFDILEAVAGDNDNLGKWHPIARFGTATGANSVKNQLNKQVQGKVLTEDQAKVAAKDRPAETRGFITPDQVREVPEYEGWTWEFDSRKVAAEDGRIGGRDSILYARLVEAAQA